MAACRRSRGSRSDVRGRRCYPAVGIPSITVCRICLARCRQSFSPRRELSRYRPGSCFHATEPTVPGGPDARHFRAEAQGWRCYGHCRGGTPRHAGEPAFGRRAAVNAIEDALRQSVKITSASKTDIDVGVTAATPKAAERIVDYLARQVVKGVGGDHAEPALQAVEKARTALDAAEGALTGFQMRHGNDIVSRIQGLQQSLHEADATIAALGEKEHDLAQAVTKVSAMKTDDVLTKALPPLPVFEALAPVRDNYTTAKLALDDVNVDHGPKHPRAIAAQGAVDAARSAAMPALRRALDGAKAELKDVAATLDAENREKAAVEEQLRSMGNAPEELAKLETALAKARREYLAASEKAGPFAAPTVTAAIAKPASPAVLQEEGILPQMIPGAMAVGGALVGMLLALFLISFRRTETEDRVGAAIQMAIEAGAAL